MKILFLGAGASIAAGYPSTAKIMGKLCEKYKEERSDAAREWREFESFLDRTKEPLRRLLRNPNPEVVISLVDLLHEAHKNEGEDWCASNWRSLDAATDAGWSPSEHPWDTEPSELKDAKIAIKSLKVCLDDFFHERHWKDRIERDQSQRRYLADELSWLEPGDFVLTTNWDTLVERTLLEQDRWRPIDGYGFHRQLVPAPPFNRALPPALLRPSDVRVLKLHGSFGWYEAPNRQIYLDWARLLQHLPLPVPADNVLFRDQAEDLKGAYDSTVALYPSFLKRLDQPQLREIWALAGSALSQTSFLHVIGYSLPESDTAIRVLLNPLRGRLDRGEVQVLVDDPNPETCERWTEFLGERTITRPRRLGEEGAPGPSPFPLPGKLAESGD